MAICPAPARVSSARDGFALPMAILVIGVLTVGITAAFVRVTNEQQVQNDQAFQVDAFALAQTGLERYVNSRTSLGLSATPAAVESTTVALTGGTATVVARRLRPAVGDDPPLYAIRSTGRTTRAQVARFGGAEHTVAQIGYWLSMDLAVRSGWTSLTGLTKSGGSGVLSGQDNCGVEADVAGVSVPTGGYVQSGGTSVPQGTPAVEEMGTPAEMADSVKIDWDAIVFDGAISPDVTIATSGAVATDFPSSTAFSNVNYWPVIEVRNFDFVAGTSSWTFSLPRSGRGTLIVHGNMVISGGLNWEGILLVGHSLVSNGNNTVQGATISALNVKLGYSVPMSDVGNGTKTFQYDSCYLASAAAAMGGMRPYANAWVDNWNVW